MSGRLAAESEIRAAEKCSTVQQGYPSITTMHDCQLSHTGFDLMFAAWLACLLIACGIVILMVRKRLR